MVLYWLARNLLAYGIINLVYYSPSLSVCLDSIVSRYHSLGLSVSRVPIASDYNNIPAPKPLRITKTPPMGFLFQS